MSKYFKGHQCQMTNWPNKIFQANNLQKNKPETSCKQTTTTTSLWFLFSHQREAITCLMNCYLFPEETLLNWRKFAWDASQTFLGFFLKKNLSNSNCITLSCTAVLGIAYLKKFWTSSGVQTAFCNPFRKFSCLTFCIHWFGCLSTIFGTNEFHF